ncbi:hypothetical protein HPB51_010806 [Rhipicephalus microplus]|uniref:Uncharacterized protein n=1 Tax=Rhipicephalus microplus TaxID=6941 RepID=A0A9J6DV41_RHIMP|nr:hypothetical protein HPB51_010806 [Rhipicephalus microplus]
MLPASPVEGYHSRRASVSEEVVLPENSPPLSVMALDRRRLIPSASSAAAQRRVAASLAPESGPCGATIDSPPDPPRGFRPWILAPPALRQQYSSLPPPPPSAGGHQARQQQRPHAARQCTTERRTAGRPVAPPPAAGLSSSGSESPDEEEEVDDDEEDEEENRSDATFTGSELALARDSTLVLQSRRIPAIPPRNLSMGRTGGGGGRPPAATAPQSMLAQDQDPAEYEPTSCLARTPSGSLFIPSDLTKGPGSPQSKTDFRTSNIIQDETKTNPDRLGYGGAATGWCGRRHAAPQPRAAPTGTGPPLPSLADAPPQDALVADVPGSAPPSQPSSSVRLWSSLSSTS